MKKWKRKFKIFWNFAQEEAWLAAMAAEGHHLKSYSILGMYTFAEGAPRQSQYKIDYKIFWSEADFNSYQALFEDAGWQHVWGTSTSGNQYFLPKTPQAGTEIFSDAASANQRYRSLFRCSVATVAATLLYTIALLFANDFDLSGPIFLTPGLWEKTGAAFWRAFFFELPFAAMRVGIWVALLVIGIAYTYWAVKAKQEYDRHAKEQELEQ